MPKIPMTKILIIYTGGTIGMVQDPVSGSLRPLDFEHITQNVPELQRLGYKLDVHSFNPLIDSSDMTPEIWIELATLIGKNYLQYDGFVILHGSDTMAYTASALSFLLENLGKPVVLTGSQLPIGEIRTDAKENLITALQIAASKIDEKAIVPEVCIYFDYHLYRGNRSSKIDSSSFEAFNSPNYSPLATAGVHLAFNTDVILKQKASLKVYDKLDNSIAVLKLFPGISPNTVNSVLNTPNIKAVILETFGAGNTSTAEWFIKALKQATDRGILIVDISQCNAGTVELGRYETSIHLVELGVLSAFDMTFEAAMTKLMFLLALDLPDSELRLKIEESLRGELTRN